MKLNNHRLRAPESPQPPPVPRVTGEAKRTLDVLGDLLVDADLPPDQKLALVRSYEAAWDALETLDRAMDRFLEKCGRPRIRAMPLSEEAIAQLEALRELLLQEHGDQVTQYHFCFTDAQVLDLAAGYVPDALKAAFRAALDWHAEDLRRAERPRRHA